MSHEKAKQAVAGAQSRVHHKLSRLWWWFLIRGILAAGLGVIALFWPEKTIKVFVSLLGIYLLIDGAIGALGAFRSGGKGDVPVFAIAGLLVGAILLFWTGVSIRIFLILVGIWALVQGIGMFFSTRKKEIDPEARKMVAIAGAILAVAGVVFILWPYTGVVTVSWLLAVVSLTVGAALIYVAFRLRGMSHRVGAPIK